MNIQTSTTPKEIAALRLIHLIDGTETLMSWLEYDCHACGQQDIEFCRQYCCTYTDLQVQGAKLEDLRKLTITQHIPYTYDADAIPF